MRLLFSLALVLFFNSIEACINIYGVDIHGNTTLVNDHFRISKINPEFDAKEISEKLKSLNKQFTSGQYSYKDVSDYGAYLLMAGKHAEGLSLFRNLIQLYPQEYNLQANLAVAFELNGLIDSALHWEKLALMTNPKAHRGSEWVHLRILETRAALQRDITYLSTNMVLFLADSLAGGTYLPGSKQYIWDVSYQLEERLPFTLNSDPVLASLLFELAAAFEAQSIYRSLFYYTMSTYFDSTLGDAAGRRKAAIEKVFQSQGLHPRKAKTYGKDGETYPPKEKELAEFLRRLDSRKKAFPFELLILDPNRIVSGMS